jgi:outer membrane immunogenic protein
MKKSVLASCAAIVFASSAYAADLPARSAAAVPAPVAVANWGGFYMGVNGGYGWASEKDPYVTPVIGKFQPKGGLFGLQAGYNHQIGSYVLGVEADYAWAGMSDSYTIAGSTVLNGHALSASASIKTEQTSLGTVRARAGYAIDNLLLYATGGYAYGGNKITLSGNATWNGVNWGAQAGTSKNYAGWVIGVGTEYAFTKNVSAKVEYLYADLGSKTYWGGTALVDKVSLTSSVIRAGLNYKF